MTIKLLKKVILFFLEYKFSNGYKIALLKKILKKN